MQTKNSYLNENAAQSTESNLDAKLKTIAELKAAEERKPEALSSLKEKLQDMSVGLSSDEREILGQLLGKSSKSPVTENKSERGDDTVFSKPQQKRLPDDDLDKVVFSKPQQKRLPDDDLDKIVFPDSKD